MEPTLEPDSSDRGEALFGPGATTMVHSLRHCDNDSPKGIRLDGMSANEELGDQDTARFEQVRIALSEPLDGVEWLTAEIGVPEWWPTGTRVAVVIAHGEGDMDDPLVKSLHRSLANSRFFTVRFNFPFAEAGRKVGDTPPEVLDKAFRAALSLLGRTPPSAPSQVFLGGTGLGALSAARIAASRFPVDGLFFLGYPLHPVDQPLKPEADLLYRLIPSMLFVQGSADPRCELDTLRRCLSRVGTPTSLRILTGADGSLLRPEARDDPTSPQTGYAAIGRVVEEWLEGLLDEP